MDVTFTEYLPGEDISGTATIPTPEKDLTGTQASPMLELEKMTMSDRELSKSPEALRV